MFISPESGVVRSAGLREQGVAIGLGVILVTILYIQTIYHLILDMICFNFSDIKMQLENDMS